jgi:hypothetical protein
MKEVLNFSKSVNLCQTHSDWIAGIWQKPLTFESFKSFIFQYTEFEKLFALKPKNPI